MSYNDPFIVNKFDDAENRTPKDRNVELLIYNLFKNIFKNNIFEEPSTDIEYYYYGVYYDEIEKNYDLMKKYYLMAIQLNHSSAMFNLAWYYQYTKENYDLMKKYYLMAIELNNSDAMDYLADYYEKNEKNNQSFVELYKYEDNFINLFNDKFKDNINLDQKYYYSFLQWKSEKISHKVKMKQYILRKTNIFPKNYDEKYLIHFIEFISLKHTKLPKDILNLIAGHLFI